MIYNGFLLCVQPVLLNSPLSYSPLSIVVYSDPRPNELNFHNHVLCAVHDS